MTRYLLDSDAIIDVLAGFPATVAFMEQLQAQGHQMCTCAVVVADVTTGLKPEHRVRGERLLGALEFLPTSREAARQAGQWRGDYRRRGIQLATTDCLIAAVAHEQGAQLITANLRDFPMPEITIFPLPRTQGGSLR